MSNHVPSLEEVREHLSSAVISDALDAAGFRTQCLATPQPLIPQTGIPRVAGLSVARLATAWVQQQRLTNTAFSNFVVM